MTEFDTDTWKKQIERLREEKDRFFGEHPHSPIPPDEREDFDGLEYYPPDPNYRFELDLEEDEHRDTITVETTTEGEQEYIRWGRFTFAVDDTECVLHAYKGDPDEDRLWVPFRDATNGEETYGAGRYLDLEADEDRTADGTWILDFNAAYSPFCAYSEEYECPLIPMENWLDVRIEAGEKTYH